MRKVQKCYVWVVKYQGEWVLWRESGGNLGKIGGNRGTLGEVRRDGEKIGENLWHVVGTW